MKRSLALLVVLFLTTLFGFGQERKRGLILNGSVQRVTTACIKGEWVTEVQVYLQFHNDSNSPVILYPPSSMFAAAIKYGTVDSTNSVHVVDSFRYKAYLKDPYGEATEEDFDQHPGIPRRLDVNNPGEAGMLLTIEPGGYYEFFDTLWPKSGFKINITASRLPPGFKPPDFMINRPCGLTQATATPEYRAFRLKYDLGLRKYRDATDLLTKLQARWKPFGNFVLASNDDIGFESEEIVLDIRK